MNCEPDAAPANDSSQEVRNPGPEDIYPLLPALGNLLLQASFVALIAEHGRERVVQGARAALLRLRQEIAADLHTAATLNKAITALAETVASALRREGQPTLVPVLNATGVLLHTNMGRAPLSHAALRHVVEVAQGYSNLELDLAIGRRGNRDQHAVPMLLRLLAQRAGQAAESVHQSHGAVLVNNCAAATMLVLNSLAEGGEVLVSRGELVEIGGGFRVPDILLKSGATLRELGTTNRTRIADYAQAVTLNTRLILRVHQSNFKMEGFVARPSLPELVELGRRTGVPIFEDQGTGLVLAPDEPRLVGESSFVESYRQGADLIAASGDKLLGGPQCGLIVGKKALTARLRENPLLRALRVDKLTYAAMEGTLASYIDGDESSIPVVRMLRMPAEAIRVRCEQIAEALTRNNARAPIEVDVVPAHSVIGGGTTPGTTLPSFAVSLAHKELPAAGLLDALRRQEPPVIARVREKRVLLDLRTIPEQDDALLIRLIRNTCAPMATAECGE